MQFFSAYENCTSNGEKESEEFENRKMFVKSFNVSRDKKNCNCTPHVDVFAVHVST